MGIQFVLVMVALNLEMFLRRKNGLGLDKLKNKVLIMRQATLDEERARWVGWDKGARY